MPIFNFSYFMFLFYFCVLGTNSPFGSRSIAYSLGSLVNIQEKLKE